MQIYYFNFLNSFWLGILILFAQPNLYIGLTRMLRLRNKLYLGTVPTSRVGRIWVQPILIPIYSLSQYFCRYWFICIKISPSNRWNIYNKMKKNISLYKKGNNSFHSKYIPDMGNNSCHMMNKLVNGGKFLS